MLKKLKLTSTPLAAASIGQVHQGEVIESAEKIVLKVQYKGVDKTIDSDLKALKLFLNLSKLIPKDIKLDDLFLEIKQGPYNIKKDKKTSLVNII